MKLDVQHRDRKHKKEPIRILELKNTDEMRNLIESFSSRLYHTEE